MTQLRQRSRRVPVVSEALGYLGGILAVVGLVLLVGQYWPDLDTWARRLTASGIGALALLGAGALVHEQVDIRRKKLKDIFRSEPIEAVVHLGVMHDPRASQAEHHSWNVAGFQKLAGVSLSTFVGERSGLA